MLRTRARHEPTQLSDRPSLARSINKLKEEARLEIGSRASSTHELDLDK
jgi:hypothetical protein